MILSVAGIIHYQVIVAWGLYYLAYTVKAFVTGAKLPWFANGTEFIQHIDTCQYGLFESTPQFDDEMGHAMEFFQ